MVEEVSNRVCFIGVTAPMTVRIMNLVAPLPHEGTAISGKKSESTAEALTRASCQDYISPVTETKVTGIGVLISTAAMSRHAQAERLFLRLAVSSMGGRAGGAARLAGAVAGTPTSVSVAHPDWRRVWAVQNRLRSCIMANLAQSAFAQSPAASGLDLSSEIIVCTPYSDIAEYQGTRAALEAEGVIPAGAKWPDGFDDLRWEDHQFHYWLRRERPEGLKGPRKLFLDVDWWMFRCMPIQAKNPGDRYIERKKNELSAAIFRQSAKGQDEMYQRLERLEKARKDVKFQAFKTAIPGINHPKRGRRPKNTEKSQGAAA